MSTPAYNAWREMVKVFVSKGVLCPIASVQEEQEWYVLHLDPNLTPNPSQAALDAKKQGKVTVESNTGERFEVHEAVFDAPHLFYHGTTPVGVKSILMSGILRFKPHRPKGVYSYGHASVSNMSSYVSQGAQLVFRSYGVHVSFKMSVQCKLKEVPVGAIFRQARSAHKRHGSKGFEWIHHQSNLKFVQARLRKDALHVFLQDCFHTLSFFDWLHTHAFCMACKNGP